MLRRQGRKRERRAEQPSPPPAVPVLPVPPPPATPTPSAVQKQRQDRVRRRRWGVGLFRLGDAVESVLGAVGITEEAVSQWLGAPCGCRRRKDKLNRLSQWVHAKLRGEDVPPPEGIESSGGNAPPLEAESPPREHQP